MSKLADIIHAHKALQRGGDDVHNIILTDNNNDWIRLIAGESPDTDWINRPRLAFLPPESPYDYGGRKNLALLAAGSGEAASILQVLFEEGMLYDWHPVLVQRYNDGFCYRFDGGLQIVRGALFCTSGTPISFPLPFSASPIVLPGSIGSYGNASMAFFKACDINVNSFTPSLMYNTTVQVGVESSMTLASNGYQFNMNYIAIGPWA